MTLEEYATLAKVEIDKMVSDYMEEHKNNPDNWPLDRTEADWGEEELMQRFN